MHFCKNPFDVLDYYGLVNEDGYFNEFAEVESLAEAKTDDKKKFCTTKLKVGAKLSFAGFINVCIDFVIKKTSFSIDKLSENDENTIVSKEKEAQIGSSGDYAKIDSTGEDSVICCAGHGSCVKTKKGSWITLAEWEFSKEKDRYVPKCVKTVFVDGETVKEDTWYTMRDGEIIEWKE